MTYPDEVVEAAAKEFTEEFYGAGAWGSPHCPPQMKARFVAAMRAALAVLPPPLEPSNSSSRDHATTAGAVQGTEALAPDGARKIGETRWFSSGGENGPVSGLEIGLANGLSLYIGELAKATLAEHEIDPALPDGWWVVLRDNHDMDIVGPVVGYDEARYLMDTLESTLSGGKPLLTKTGLEAQRYEPNTSLLTRRGGE